MLGSPTILPAWAGIRLADVLQERLGMDVLLENDANLGALAELSFGAARGQEFVAYIRAYSGIGAGLIVGRQAVSAAPAGRPARSAT